MGNKRRQANRLRTVDLFAGCGGLSLGFQNAGFDVVAAYDNWELAHLTYKKNFSHDAHLLDMADVEQSIEHVSQYSPEVIVGGPPCQDFSIAGKRKESTRASLTISFARIVSALLPQIVAMENVYNIEGSKSLKRAKEILSRAGYGLTSMVLDASLTGVPQRRKRYFLIGELEAADGAFESQLASNLASESMTVFDYFGDSLGTEYYYAHPRSYNRRAVFSVHEPSSTIRRVNRPIPKNYQKHPADKVEISEEVRPLTTEERSRIQTFPKGFQFCGTASQQEHLIANAVPVKLAQYVAEQISACPCPRDEPCGSLFA